MIINSQIPTKIELNGPILSFDSGIAYHPVAATANSGESVTFTGLATAIFPEQSPPNPAENSGYISYNWYEVGVGALSDGGRISGALTRSLTISDLKTPQDSNRKFYLKADYVNSAYALPVGSAVTVGTAKSTGNALNDGLDSNIVAITVNPQLVVVTNPVGQTVSQTKTACFSAEGSLTDLTQGDFAYQWQVNGQDLVNGSNDLGSVTGATSNTVCITSSNIGEYLVRAKLTHPTASNSPLYTESARYTVVSARQIINAEFINQGAAVLSGTASYNLFDLPNGVQFDGSNVTGLICLYAAEKDVSVIMECYASKGADNNGYSGGEGGICKVKFTMQAGQEYIINNIPQANNSGAIFVYRQERLLFAVGAGGNAGTGGAGGAGGGINVAGGDGSGRGAGSGGPLYQAGTLPFPGIFGSAATNITLAADDSFAPVPFGGRIIPCPRGDYWRNLGYAPCQRIGQVQFYTQPGSLVPGTAIIDRGFKAGYGIRNTAGRGINGGGTGGNGAGGGNGGDGGGGGGGGSGYSDGSVTILETGRGGNPGQPRVVLKLGDLL